MDRGKAQLDDQPAVDGVFCYNQSQVNLLATLGLIDQANVGWRRRQKT